MTTISQEAVVADVEDVLRDFGVSLEEFVSLGSQDELEADTLRDLWLMTKAVLGSSEAHGQPR